MIIFISMLSFILDIFLMKYLSPNTILLPLLTIVSLVIIYPYFNDNNYRYFKYIAILGLLYDIVITNTLFLNFFIFMIVGFAIIFLSYLLSNNLMIDCLISIISIIIYKVIIYLLTGNLNIYILLDNILRSLLLNILYCILIYIISEHYSKKYKILRSK